MGAILLSLATFFSTLLGGLFGLRYRDHLNLIMGFTAGVLVGLVSFAGRRGGAGCRWRQPANCSPMHGYR